MNHEFEKNGIIVLKKFITKDEVNNFRNLIEAELVNFKDKKYFGYDELTFSNKILSSIINNRLSYTLKSIFQNVIVLPDFILQYSNTPKKLLIPHYDCQSFIYQGMSNSLSNLKNAKIGLYLQKSDKDNPGAIWYVPGSHKNRFNQFIIDSKIHKSFKVRINSFYKKFMTSKQIPLQCEAGDLVIFHGRLLHSSSPQTNSMNLSQIKKLAVYFSVAGTKDDANSFMRSEFIKLADEITSKKINDIQRISYVFSKISSDLNHLCVAQGIKSYLLSGEKIRKFKLE